VTAETACWNFGRRPSVAHAASLRLASFRIPGPISAVYFESRLVALRIWSTRHFLLASTTCSRPGHQGHHARRHLAMAASR
jgi:hypothetical protein